MMRHRRRIGAMLEWVTSNKKGKKCEKTLTAQTRIFLLPKPRGSSVLAVPVLIFDTTDNFKQSGSVTTDEHMLSWYICACDLTRGKSGQPQLFTTYTWSSQQIAKPTHQYTFFFFFFFLFAFEGSQESRRQFSVMKNPPDAKPSFRYSNWF